MVRQRPRRAVRPPLPTRVARIAVPVALAGIITTGVAVAASPGQAQIAYPAPAVSIPAVTTSASPVLGRHDQGSRAVTGLRPSVSSPPSPSASPTTSAAAKTPAKSAPKASKPVVKSPPLKVTDTKYATVELNIRKAAQQKSEVLTVVKPGTKLKVTATVRDGFRYISYDGTGRWVKNQYLSDKKPDPATTGGISAAPCQSGSSMESGLTSDAIKVHRALCARYPQITAFGGRRGGGGNHGSGRAVDNMISDSTAGWQVARWVRAHAKELGVSEIIYSQKIWTVQRGREGWRSMSDRGSKTANHYDHVHVSVYGNRATS